MRCNEFYSKTYFIIFSKTGVLVTSPTNSTMLIRLFILARLSVKTFLSWSIYVDIIFSNSSRLSILTRSLSPWRKSMLRWDSSSPLRAILAFSASYNIRIRHFPDIIGLIVQSCSILNSSAIFSIICQSRLRPPKLRSECCTIIFAEFIFPR